MTAVEHEENNEKKTKVREIQETYAIQVEINDEPDSWLNFAKLWQFTGPGFLMSIAYLDPGNIEGDLQSGAVAQFKLIWVLMVAHILGLLLQRLAARLGVVAGRHMAEVAHSYYPKVPRLILWVMVEIAIIASDMQEVIGTAISLYLLSNGIIPLWAGVLITIFDTFTFLILERYGVRKFEAFFCFLISCMAITFGYEFFRSQPPAGPIFQGMFEPWCAHCGTPQFLEGIGVIGSVIMPHNFYLHSALVKSRKVDRTRKSKVVEANKYFFIESGIALFCSFWINFLVVAVFGVGMYGKTNQDVRDICYNNTNSMPDFYKQEFPDNLETAEVDIYHAGIYLGCAFGVGALYVWAVGILAAGQSSTMTGTYAGQFAMEGFVQIRLPQWKRILITRSLAIAPTLTVVLFSGGIDHITGLNDFLNCVQMIQLPFAVIPIITFVSDKQLMRDFAASRLNKVFMVTVSMVILLINFYFLYEWIDEEIGWSTATIVVTAILFVCYMICVLYLTYYCFVAMSICGPFLEKYCPLPQYEHFDAPWEDYEQSDGSSRAITLTSNDDAELRKKKNADDFEF